MNTLPRAVTARIIVDADRYMALRRHWSALMTSDARHELAPAHHLLYQALRGRDWRRAFTPITNPRRLANGAFVGWALFRALGQIHAEYREDWLLAPFAGIVTPAMLVTLRALLPRANPYQLDATDIATGGLPFDAYLVLQESSND